MNESLDKKPQERAASPARPVFTRSGCLIIAGLLFVFFFLSKASVFPLVHSSGPLQALGLGWLYFLERTVPKVTWSWDIVGLALFCILGILFIGHYLLARLVLQISQASGKAWHWPWKWTWCGLCGVFIFFFTGMAIGGMVHQIGWLMTSREPLYEVKGGAFRTFSDMRQLEAATTYAITETNHNLTAFKKVYAETTSWFHSYYDGKVWPESYQVFFVVTNREDVVGTLVFPREANLRKKVGGIFSVNDSGNTVSSEQISDLLHTNPATLVPF